MKFPDYSQSLNQNAIFNYKIYLFEKLWVGILKQNSVNNYITMNVLTSTECWQSMQINLVPQLIYKFTNVKLTQTMQN